MAKKVLTGYAYFEWKKGFNFDGNSDYSLTFRNKIIQIPQIFKTSKELPYRNKKVKIIIEEI